MFFFFRNFPSIKDLYHGPRVLAIGLNRKLSPLFRDGIGGVVERVI
jgi:hypothetical protein